MTNSCVLAAAPALEQLEQPALSAPMNFTTQAAQDILTKIERDPAEVRHWRQLLILCFDQKSIDTLQTLQVIVAAIEQIWNQRRQKAKDAYEEAAEHVMRGGELPSEPEALIEHKREERRRASDETVRKACADIEKILNVPCESSEAETPA